MYSTRNGSWFSGQDNLTAVVSLLINLIPSVGELK